MASLLLIHAHSFFKTITVMTLSNNIYIHCRVQNFSDVSEIAILLIIFVFPGLPCIIAHTSELFPLADFGRWPCRLCVSRSPRRSRQLSLLTHQLCLRLSLTCRSHVRHGSEQERRRAHRSVQSQQMSRCVPQLDNRRRCCPRHRQGSHG